jgi:predicted transposase YdaD
MTDITNPHDKFFKEALTQPGAALAFLRDYLPPDVAAQLDLATLAPLKDSFVDTWLQEYFADLVFEVELRERRTAYVCFLFEHKSYVDPWTPLQVLHYMVLAWKYGMQHRGRLVPVIPIVVYHGAVPWRAPHNFHALFDLPDALLPYIPEFRYLLNDLSTVSDEELERSAEIGVAGKDISEDDVRQVLEEAELEQEAIMGTIAQELLERGERRGLQQGLQQGQLQGLQQGLQQGLMTGIRLALKLKFGLAGAALVPEIAKIEDVVLLQTIGDAIELADTPDQVRKLYQRG